MSKSVDVMGVECISNEAGTCYEGTLYGTEGRYVFVQISNLGSSCWLASLSIKQGGSGPFQDRSITVPLKTSGIGGHPRTEREAIQDLQNVAWCWIKERALQTNPTSQWRRMIGLEAPMIECRKPLGYRDPLVDPLEADEITAGLKAFKGRMPRPPAGMTRGPNDPPLVMEISVKDRALMVRAADLAEECADQGIRLAYYEGRANAVHDVAKAAPAVVSPTAPDGQTDERAAS